MPAYYLACDLGAESGRLMLGALHAETKNITLQEIHRFPNNPVKQDGALLWNIPALFAELLAGLKKAAASGLPISSISADSWGVDYVLLDENGSLIEPAFHYRDSRTARGVKTAFAKIPWKTIFEETGIQFMPLNTLFQLAAETPERFARAASLLGVGDGFNFLLSGVARVEESMASTFQLYNPRASQWSARLLEELDFPKRLFPPIVPSGTVLGPLKSEVAAAAGLPPLQVIASCSHDTGAAVAAVPAEGSNWAYLSSGTWSLMGVERSQPIVTDACRELNFTNEIGYNRSIRLLKNIVGLWIVQECKRAWAEAGTDYDYARLTDLASSSAPFRSLINPADPRFLAPDQMPEKINAYCRETGQPCPESPAQAVRCVLESLALLYRRTLAQLESLASARIERLHIVGGGSKNSLLNQFTADALRIPVFAGPVEATALGNVLIQALALRHLPSWEQARQVVRASYPLEQFQPHDETAWNNAFEHFERLP